MKIKNKGQQCPNCKKYKLRLDGYDWGGGSKEEDIINTNYRCEECGIKFIMKGVHPLLF